MNLVFLDPGRLTARLELEMRTEMPDGQGGVLERWDVLRSLWAAMEPVSEAFHERASAEGVTITHRVWLTWCSDIAAGMRFRKGRRILGIRTVMDPDETRRFIVCRCEEESP
ncbi:phage head closure protein [Agrobacterium tumefaciens]|uniref:phage head closure protein n=1 Tax=Agrobacterium tumefaciens TaxID=358 RepID=UPI001572D46D|nr:phage head closure protein [Agrobacterium tumefaciens]NTE57209.1 phage head closure protein [Agrobacterium tumefaciens]NTE70906.1 phage head closure protein [Agrobacterium tumefaciens]